MLILGVGFAVDDAAPVTPTLDVILTQTQTALTPKQADFLAQASQPGRRRTRQDPAPARHPGRAGAAAARRAWRRAPLHAQTPAAQPATGDARGHRDHRAASPCRTPQPRPEADASRTCRRACEKIDRDIAMARLAAEIHLRSAAVRQAPEAQVRLGQHQGIRLGRATCAAGWTGSSGSATSIIPTRPAGAGSAARW